MRNRTTSALLALVAAVAVVASAGLAAVSATPDPARMALQPKDIPNSKAKGKRLKPDAGYVASYEREFELSKPFGPSRLIYIDSEVALASAVKTTKADMASLRKFLRSRQARELLATGIAKQLGKNATKKDVMIGKLRTPPIGDESVLLPLAVRSDGVRFHAAISWFRLDRTLSLLVVVGLRPVGPVEVGKLGTIVAAHVGEQLTPASTAPPTITGAPQQGQTLTAAPGTFTTAATFAYAWQRCDAAGAACVDIAGATAPTYVVATEDVNTTLRVVVTATNRFGTATAQSAQTILVT